jgi:hypothetical protein
VPSGWKGIQGLPGCLSNPLHHHKPERLCNSKLAASFSATTARNLQSPLAFSPDMPQVQCPPSLRIQIVVYLYICKCASATDAANTEPGRLPTASFLPGLAWKGRRLLQDRPANACPLPIRRSTTPSRPPVKSLFTPQMPVRGNDQFAPRRRKNAANVSISSFMALLM